MKRCEKCHGCLVPEIQEYPLPDTQRCIQCGWRPPCAPICPPIEPNPNRQWTPGNCEYCGNPAMRKKPYCLVCYRKSMGEDHGKAVSIGMRAARAQK